MKDLINEENFKDIVLDLLGISFNINANSLVSDDAKQAAKSIKTAKEGDTKNDAAVKDLISKEINHRIENASTPNEAKRLEASIKSISLNDILKHSSGNNISDAFYKANHEDYTEREARRDAGRQRASADFPHTKKIQVFDKSGDVEFQAYFCLGSGTGKQFTKGNEQLNYGKGDILFISNKNLPKGPEKYLETIVRKIFGGYANLGANDAIKDLRTGATDVSVKCYKKGGATPKVSSNLATVANIESGTKIKLEVYRYDIFTSSNGLYCYLCSRDEVSSGIITNKGIISKDSNYDNQNMEIRGHLNNKKLNDKNVKNNINNDIRDKLRQNAKED